jgi:hypothetical protein
MDYRLWTKKLNKMTLIARIDYSNTYTSGSQINGQVYIALFDADTGQPANGNNVTETETRLNNLRITVLESQVTLLEKEVDLVRFSAKPQSQPGKTNDVAFVNADQKR